MTDQVKKLFRAAGQRLTIAEALLNSHGALLEALYLGGYSIECCMKSMILRSVAPSQRDAFCEEEFRGKNPHNFEWLYGKWKLLNCEPLPAHLRDRIRSANLIWNTDLRYETGTGGRSLDDVSFVLELAHDLRQWVERRLK